MQTSAAVVLRALVMLACLIVIPLVALFGSSLPKMVTSVLEGRWPAGAASENGPKSEKSAGAEPSQFEPAAPPGGIPAGSAEPMMPNWRIDPLKDSLKWPGGPLEAPASPVTPVGYESPLAERSISPQPFAGAAPGSEIRQTTATVHRGTPAGGGAGPATQSLNSADQFKHIHERLRELGATYYLLESWGNQHDYYRFYCQMAIGGNPTCSRPFQATHSDPIQAMSQVLQQVESWRAGRQ